MKYRLITFSIFIVLLFSHGLCAYAYDATGLWSYAEYDVWSECGTPDPAESGEIILLQTGNSALIIAEDFSVNASVSGSVYSFENTFCDDGGQVSISASANITLTSATTATGTINAKCTLGNYSCYAGHKLALSKQTQTTPAYDATGTWNFNQSGFWDNCGDASTPRSSGSFTLTQSGNIITAVDDQGISHSGFVNGKTYTLVNSYLEDGGRTTHWVNITLSSETEGSGTGHFVWDDDCYSCNGGARSLSVTKAISTYTIIASAGKGGTISPSGTMTAFRGDSQTFSITPDGGYKIISFFIDDTPQPTNQLSSYTLENITADHSLQVNFGKTNINPGVQLLLIQTENQQ